jgi:hypothetical protein
MIVGVGQIARDKKSLLPYMSNYYIQLVIIEGMAICRLHGMLPKNRVRSRGLMARFNELTDSVTLIIITRIRKHPMKTKFNFSVHVGPPCSLIIFYVFVWRVE